VSQIEYGSASFFVELEFSRGVAGRDPFFVSDFFLYRLVSFVHPQNLLP